MAPELLTRTSCNSKESDVYSFGVIIYEVFARKDPYEGELTADVLRDVVDPQVNKRPRVPRGCSVKVAILMSDCLCAAPLGRPQFGEIDSRLQRLDNEINDRPSADLYISTTLVCMDIEGFTAWSSARDPTEVFTLLEVVHGEFDKIAKLMGIVRVESFGESYMAVAGIPDPRPDHAVVIVEFAQQCIARMSMLTKELVRSMGPDTCDLGLKVGIHSGQITGGPLRSDRSKYQLVGETKNTTNVMVTMSKSGCIQVSEETAALLVVGGKKKWLTQRKDQIGTLKTFWFSTQNSDTLGTATQSAIDWGTASLKEDSIAATRERREQLINWTVEQLVDVLKKIAYVQARRC
jgi:class 3 adenylate cyclase